MAKELDVTFETPLLKQLAEELRAKLGDSKRADGLFNKHMRAALKVAMQPGVKLLKDATPRGPTGNLKRSVKIITREYRKEGVWFGAVGYSASGEKSRISKGGFRTGSNLGYHQGLVEFGTKQRKSEGRIASSISRFTSLTVTNMKRTGQLRTKPKPPKGFFKSAPAGQRVDLGQMRPQKNIPKVYGMADDFMESALRRDMTDRVEKAWENFDWVNRNKK